MGRLTIRSGRNKNLEKHLKHIQTTADLTVDVITCEEIIQTIPEGFKLRFLDCCHEKMLVEYLNKKGNTVCIARSQPRESYLKSLHRLEFPVDPSDKSWIEVV